MNRPPFRLKPDVMRPGDYEARIAELERERVAAFRAGYTFGYEDARNPNKVWSADAAIGQWEYDAARCSDSAPVDGSTKQTNLSGPATAMAEAIGVPQRCDVAAMSKPPQRCVRENGHIGAHLYSRSIGGKDR